jgi:hypothetical protein
MKTQFKKGDPIERFQGEPVNGIKNNTKVTFARYFDGGIRLGVFETDQKYFSKNFRRWVEIPAEPIKPKFDLSKYRAFPEGYVIPKGVRVVALSDDRTPTDEYYVKPGSIGITIESDLAPRVKWDDRNHNTHLMASELAPLNTEDHPDWDKKAGRWKDEAEHSVEVEPEKPERPDWLANQKQTGPCETIQLTSCSQPICSNKAQLDYLKLVAPYFIKHNAEKLFAELIKDGKL